MFNNLIQCNEIVKKIIQTPNITILQILKNN